jgi:bla regulator protein BlaR1
MNLTSPITADLIRAFGWAIIHSIWQAFFVYACLRIVLKLWPMANAQTKYNLSLLSLGGIFTWFMITLYQQLSAIQHSTHFSEVMLAPGTTLQPIAPVYENQTTLIGLFPNLEIFFPALVALYGIGITIMSIKLVVDVQQLQQIRKKQVIPIDVLWEKYLQQLTEKLHIPRKVKLMVSQSLQVPVMIGFFKPLILLPMAMVNNMSEDQLEAILLHELAHIKRNDYLLNIFQSIAETILFFNPFIWWISKNIRLEREHCCDDLVISSSVQPLHYAHALVALEEYRLNSNPLAMAAADNKQHLFYRIKRIMEMKTKNLNYSQKILAILIIATGFLSIAWLNPANKKDSLPPQETIKTTVRPVPPVHPVSPITPALADITAPIAPIATNIVTPVSISATINNTTQTTVLSPIQDTLSPLKQKINSIDKTQEQTVKDERLSKEDERELTAAKEQMREAQAQMREAEQTLREINWKELNANIKASLKSIDWENISKAQREAMKNIDWENISKAHREAMKNIDWKKINKDVSLAMQNINWQQIQNEIQAVQANVNLNEIMVGVKEGLKQAKAGMELAQRESLASLKDAQNAKEQAMDNDLALQKGKAERDSYRHFINAMVADKLLDTTQPFIIEKKNNELYINGIKQPGTVTTKYSKYLKGNKMTIKGENDNLDINIDNN